GRFLTEVVHFAHSVPVAGMVEYRSDQGDTMTLAMLQVYVPNQGDGWTYTLDYLARFFEQGQVATPEPASVHGGYLALIRTLGQRTAELHIALATKTGDPAFDPEPIEPHDLVLWMQRIRDEAGATLDQLAQRRAMLAETARAKADALLEKRAAILQRIEQCVPQQVQAVKIRYHGDLHLGQLLLTQNDFVIIDFEGEPGRSLVERRQKHCALADVAGMLRSFNYAKYTALLHSTAERPDDLLSFEPLGHAWEAETAQAFISAYREAAQDGGLFATWDGVQGLLDLFLFEKAFYELRYELDNRPDWVHIPLRGLLDMAGATDGQNAL
ncbi:MAG: phosphotransferase, partial [Burkholderiaceae bacterium]